MWVEDVTSASARLHTNLSQARCLRTGGVRATSATKRFSGRASRAIWILLQNLRIASSSLKAGGRVVVIGDSHANLLSGQAGFVVLQIGPVTLHRLGRPGELVRAIRRRYPIMLLPGFRLGRRDVVIVSAGEIDVRCHVQRQITTQSREERAVIDELARAIAMACSEIERSFGCRAGVLAIPPPRNPDGASYRLPQEYPIRGTLAQRVRWTNLLNEYLEYTLLAEGHLFVPMPPGLSNADGSLKEDCSDGNVHVDRRFGTSVSSRVLSSL